MSLYSVGVGHRGDQFFVKKSGLIVRVFYSLKDCKVEMERGQVMKNKIKTKLKKMRWMAHYTEKLYWSEILTDLAIIGLGIFALVAIGARLW